VAGPRGDGYRVGTRFSGAGEQQLARRSIARRPGSDRRSEAFGPRVREPRDMLIDHAIDAAEPITAIDCALAVQAAEAVVERRLSAPAPRA
jgi:hypothetical protein